MRFFTLEEAAAIEALAERFFPCTDEGPGATDAKVVAFIDGQLASPWGQGDRMYREGPFAKADHAGHGWQSPLTPAEAYRYGLSALEDYVAREFNGRSIRELRDAELDDVLQILADGAIDTFGDELSAELFFTLLKDNIAEGLFSDPMYGGNHDCIGWRWIGFPGDPDSYGQPYATRFGLPSNYAVEPQALRSLAGPVAGESERRAQP